MPVLQVHYPKGALDAASKRALAAALTEVLLNMEGGARTPGGLAFATVLFAEIQPEDWWVGGKTDSTHVAPPGKFLVRVSVPEGYMSQLHKSAAHSMVNQAFLEVLGDPKDPTQGANILVTIEEITEGNWGCRGETISLGTIADRVGLSKSGDRFGWVKAYFAAKARQFAAACYPADTGGLLPMESSSAIARREGGSENRATMRSSE
jgi:phenylpyruvate tautomerase PptA (4-oxalocrotonate tautomerase family)